MSDPVMEIGESALEASDEKFKSLVNRMVNAETPGFKSSDVTIRSFPIELEIADKKLNAQQPKVEGVYYDHSQGALIKTGRSTDLALAGEGFFVIMGGWGEGYTRDGRFLVNKDGILVTAAGNHPVLGQNGTITVNPASKIEVSQNGEIKADSAVVDKLRVVDVSGKQNLESVNGVIFKAPATNIEVKEIDNARIVQGYIESSNTRSNDLYRDMIVINREYNMANKILSIRDQTLGKDMEIGKVQ